MRCNSQAAAKGECFLQILDGSTVDVAVSCSAHNRQDFFFCGGGGGGGGGVVSHICMYIV